MYRISLLIALFFTINLALAQEKNTKIGSDESSENSNSFFGDKIDASNAILSTQMLERYTNLNKSDSLETKFSAKVLEVCKVKGCWMRLALDSGENAMVKFKDYGFFMPLDITGKEVVVNGVAFVNEVSIEEQKHYALDGGKTEEEIAKITAPKKTFGFLANGVLLKE